MASSQQTQNRQLVKLECNLRTLSTLTLSAEKKELVKDSKFFPLANITNKKESSSTLVAALSFLFDNKNKIFKFNEQLRFRFCAKEVAEVLGINDAGKDFTTFKKESSKLSKKFPETLDRLKKLLVEGEKKNGTFSADLKTILRVMSVKEDEEKVLFVKIFSFYVIEQFLLGGTDSKRPRCSFWSYVDDLRAMEDVNWTKSVFEHLMVALEDLRKGLEVDTNKTKTHHFKGCAPVLEAIIYKRIPSLAPKNGDLNLFPLIQKYSACRRDIGGWKFSHLTANDVEPCPHCTLPTPCSPPGSPPGSSVSDKIIHNFENMQVTPPPVSFSIDLTWADRFPVAEEEAKVEQEQEQEVPALQAPEVPVHQVVPVRRTSRTSKPVQKLISQMSGVKGKKKKNK